MLFFLSIFACNSSSTFEITGTDGYSGFNPQTAYYGSSFILFVSKPIDCIDMFWVQKTNIDGEEPPYDQSLEALQVTFNDSEVVEGSFSVGGEAPIKAEFLTIQDNTFAVDKATEGTLELDEIVEETAVNGAFNFAFSEGQLSGTFDVDWCLNIK